MARLLSVVVATAFMVAFHHPMARAVDQTVLGKSFVVKDPIPGFAPTLRSVVILGKEPASDNAVVGNPITNGARVEVIANGANSSSQTFSMPAGALTPGGAGWKALGTTGYG